VSPSKEPDPWVKSRAGFEDNHRSDDTPASPQLGLFTTKRNPAATSRLAFQDVTISGVRGRHKRELVAWLRSQSVMMTSAEIAREFGIERHAAARRLPDAENDGTVKHGPVRVCTVTGRPSITWGAT